MDGRISWRNVIHTTLQTRYRTCVFFIKAYIVHRFAHKKKRKKKIIPQTTEQGLTTYIAYFEGEKKEKNFV